MITIHNEVSIELGDPQEQTLTLWLVSYGSPRDTGKQPDYWPMFVEALSHFCARRGWLLETGDDPYRDKSLAVFAEGFSWPPEQSDELDEGQYLPYGEPDDDDDVF